MQNNSKKIFLFPILLAVFTLGFFGFSAKAQAANVFYVDKDCVGGSIDFLDCDHCSGGTGTATKTINEAVSSAYAGDTVHVCGGTYYETVQMPRSGTAEGRITIEGELDGEGNQLAIIDPTIPTNTWALDATYGPYVYKTATAFDPSALYYYPTGWASGIPYDIPKVCNKNVQTKQSQCQWWGATLAKSRTELYWAGYPEAINPANPTTVLWWDGIDAFYTSDGVSTWVKFYDTSVVPTSSNMRIANTAVSGGATIYIPFREYITIKDLEIHASQYGVYIANYGGAGSPISSSHIIIDNNKMLLGAIKVFSSGHANLKNYDIEVSNNEIYMQGYSSYLKGDESTFRAWATNAGYPVSEEILTLYHTYSFYKYEVGWGNNDRDEGGINLYHTTYSSVHDNIIHEGMDAFGFNDADYTNVYNNEVYNMSSTGMFFNGGSDTTGLIVHDNYIHNADTNFRIGSAQKGRYQAKLYNNKSWQPQGVGKHIFFHHDPVNSPPTLPNPLVAPGTPLLDFWWYHNSFSGGSEMLDAGDYANNYLGYVTLDNVHYVNNIMSSPVWTGETVPVAVGYQCEYNWVTGSNGSATYCTTANHNINNGLTLMWDTPDPHNFNIPSAYRAGTAKPAEDSACDMTDSVAQYSCGSNLSAFPGVSSFTMFGGGFDIGAVEMGNTPDNPADVNGDGNINIKDIQVVIQVITGTETRADVIARADVNGDAYVNIKDIQAIIQAIINSN